MKILRNLAFFIVLFGSAPLYAKEVTFDFSKFSDLLSLGIQNSTKFKASELEAQQAAEIYIQSRSALMPSVQASISRSRIDQSQTGSSSESISSLYSGSNEQIALKQSILNVPLIREVQAKKFEADSRARAVEWQFGMAILDFLTLLSENHIANMRRESLNLEERIASLRVLADEASRKSGLSSIPAGLRSKKELATKRDRSLENSVSRDRSRLRLARLLGIADSTYIKIPDFDLNFSRILISPREQCDVRSNPNIVAKLTELRATETLVSAASARHLPSIDLSISSYRTNSDNAYFINSKTAANAVTVSVNIPIFSGGLITSKSREMTLELTKKRLELDQMIYEADVERVVLSRRLEDNLRTIDDYKDLSVVAPQMADAALKARQLGVINELKYNEERLFALDSAIGRYEKTWALLLDFLTLETLCGRAGRLMESFPALIRAKT